MSDENARGELEHWRRSTDSSGVLWLAADKADGGANVLSAPVLRELDAIIGGIEDDPPKGVVIYSVKPSGFIMGADINEFTRIESTEQAFELVRLGQQVLDRLEALRCPTVTVIDGYALGGGLELAMACDYRLAVDSDRKTIGLPEVQLGIHPGFGGTVRAVQIAGVTAAMELMLTGKSLTPKKAKATGLVDRLVARDNWKAAAREIIGSRPPRSRAGFTQKLLNLAPVRPFVAKQMRARVAKRARQDHYPAPYAIVDLWQKHGGSPDGGYVAEARSIAELMCTDTSRNLVRVFFLQNRLKAQGSSDAPRARQLHVVGAGVMGGDIAAWCALRGLEVTLQDREEKYITPALERAEKLFGKRIRDDAEREAAKGRLRADVAGDGVAGADIVIEAIFEDKEAKQDLYRELEPKMKDGAVLATNTSSIRLEELRTVLSAPARLIGLHFFNPVAQLPLVEVIRCADTEAAAIDAGHAFVKTIGKYPLECASSPGFVVNRVLAPYMGEAMRLHEEGVPLEIIDQAAVDFGMPMGPVELADSVGLDVAWHVSTILADAYGYPLPEKLREMVDAGNLGRKSGQGFYRWEDGKAVKQSDAEGPEPPDLQDRLILPMVNEAVACLAEGVVEDEDLLDAGVIFGTGFAPFRGGPLHYARSRGVAEIRSRLEKFAMEYGQRFRPADGWDAFSSGED
ncbi:3-hydroxyacyl-CoA dehydrogenase NAD-binding domain-containing protein [Lentisalinibacter sediminis]|uniref:3-hydroxyacyl-CoA dehydrogenase NAD-binding domain-containing protein n=1 Tax=Lentisalinibacter sediminis TaxID=2992237 RepID=UPI003867AAE9